MAPRGANDPTLELAPFSPPYQVTAVTHQGGKGNQACQNGTGTLPVNTDTAVMSDNAGNPTLYSPQISWDILVNGQVVLYNPSTGPVLAKVTSWYADSTYCGAYLNTACYFNGSQYISVPAQSWNAAPINISLNNQPANDFLAFYVTVNPGTNPYLKCSTQNYFTTEHDD